MPGSGRLGLLRAIGGQNLMRVVSLGGQDLSGLTLEVVKRPWELGRFGDFRIVCKNLRGPLHFIRVLQKRSERVSLTTTALAYSLNASQA